MDLLKIMLVDDELTTLTKLKTLMNYEKHGFYICGEASGAKSAIDLIKSCQPDILFTDMKMPGMDGVELICYLKKYAPHIKVIAISGYEDFNYVYQGLQNGACDYLLKHKLDKDRMLSVLDKVRIQLMQERDLQQRELVNQSRLSVADKIVEKEIIRKVLIGEDAIQVMGEPGLSAIFRRFYMVLFVMDELYENRKVSQTLEDFMEKIFSEAGICRVVPMDQGSYVVLISFGEIISEQKHYDTLFHAMRRCQNSALRFLNCSLSCCRSGLLTDFVRLRDHYEQLGLSICNRFYTGPGKILDIMNGQNHMVEFSFPDVEDGMGPWVEVLRKRLLDYLSFAQESFMPPGQLKKTCKMVIRRLLEEGERWGYSKTDLDMSHLEQGADLDLMITFSQVEQFLMDIFKNCSMGLPSYLAADEVSPKIGEALRYIHQNFINPISLDTVSDVVGLNEAYLCRIFKEETGKGMTEYLKELRIQKARHLLEHSSYRIKDICKLCGFNDYGYFVKAFKGAVGKTPVQYRENK